VVWIYVIITSSFLYWERDGGGPEARARSAPEYMDLAPDQSVPPAVTERHILGYQN